MINDFLGNELDGHPHVFTPVEGCFQVHVGDVSNSKARTLGPLLVEFHIILDVDRLEVRVVSL